MGGAGIAGIVFPLITGTRLGSDAVWMGNHICRRLTRSLVQGLKKRREEDMQRPEWQNLKERVFEDFPNLCWVENVKDRREKGSNFGDDEDPIFDDNGENIGFPWSFNGDPSDPLLEIFGLCGCGDPDSVIKTYYHPFLRAIKIKTDQIRSSSFAENCICASKEKGEAIWKSLNGEKVNHTCFKVVEDQALEYLILYALDHFQLTEHGSFIGGCWLTKKGETALLMCDAIFGKPEEKSETETKSNV